MLCCENDGVAVSRRTQKVAGCSGRGRCDGRKGRLVIGNVEKGKLG